VAVTPIIGANRTQGFVGDVEAAFAESNSSLGISDGISESCDVVLGDLEEVESYSLGGLWSDSRQASELIDQSLDGCGVRR
jgi:hypothetical protein